MSRQDKQRTQAIETPGKPAPTNGPGTGDADPGAPLCRLVCHHHPAKRVPPESVPVTTHAAAPFPRYSRCLH
jgi:hypothetical protein